MATLLSFVRPQPHDWSNDEKAQFARIQNLLADAGVGVDVEYDLTDEGEPWCVLCSGATGEVIIHIARIDGQYLFDSAALPSTIKGRSLDDCAQRFIDDAALLAQRPRQESKILLHPSTLLVSVMLMIYLYLEATGESLAHERVPAGDGLEDVLDGSDIIEVAEIPKEAASTRSADANDGDASPLVVLKNMLQQIVDTVQKSETDRTGGNATLSIQNWVSVLLPTVVATIAYTQDGIAGLTIDDEAPLPSIEAEAATGSRSVLSEAPEEAELDPASAEDTVIAGNRGDPAPADVDVEIDVVDAMLDSFLMIETEARAFGERGIAVAPTALVDMVVEDAVLSEAAFVFVDGAPATDAAVLQPSLAEAPVMLSQGEQETSMVHRLMQFVSTSSIDIRDETFALSDFIEAVDVPGIVIGIGPDDPDAFDAPLIVAAPLHRPDTLSFLPFEPDRDLEVVSDHAAAQHVAAFVRMTGLLRYDTSDRSHLTFYDRSIMGLENSDDVEQRSFALYDDSTVTFVGFGHELDLIFA